MNLAVDLGNYNINTDVGVMFSSTFIEEDASNPLNEELITFGDKTYAINRPAEFDYEFNKTLKNYKPNLLYAIDKSLQELGIEDKEYAINVILGIPIENIGVSVNYKEDLEGKEFEFIIDKGTKKERSRKIRIDKVGVVREGVSSFYALPKIKRKNRDVMIIDIGGRTINVCTFKNGKLEHTKQINRGMIDFYNDVKTAYNSKNGNNINTEDVDHLIQKGHLKTNKEEEVKFVEKMFNSIKSIANRNFYDIYITGGGAIRLEDTIVEIEPRCELMDEALFTNAYGNKKIADAKWGE